LRGGDVLCLTGGVMILIFEVLSRERSKERKKESKKESPFGGGKKLFIIEIKDTGSMVKKGDRGNMA